MPDSSGTHLKITAAAVQAIQGAALEGPASPIEAYSYDMHILDAVQDSPAGHLYQIGGPWKPSRWILL